MQLEGLGERCKLPQWESGAKPQRTTILVLFEHLERLFLAL